MKSFEIPISDRDIVGVKSGVVLDPVNVQAARQKESDSIASHEVVELVKMSECKQGVAHVKGDFVDDNKGDIVRSRFVAKQVAYDPRDDVSHCPYSVSCSALQSLVHRYSVAARWCYLSGTYRWLSFTR